MATKLFTNKFKTYAIEKFISSRPAFYTFMAKSTEFDDDTNPPSPIDNVDETYVQAHDNMISAKSISNTDISFMIPRHDWVSGTAYKAYRDNSADLYGNSFYVSVASATGYDVFKCLSNNNTVSVASPTSTATSPADDIYETSDGYQWKLMYSIPTATYNKFATRDYIPVFANTAISANAVAGAIDYIDVGYGGSSYNTHTSGTIQIASVSGNNRQFAIESTGSTESNFYVGSAIKITSGTGAGQLRTIEQYNVTGATRIVVVDTPFTVTPTTSSAYEISPNVVVVGSGTGFQGRALVNAAASNTVYKVEIVNRGSGYHYASATVVGNTGGSSNSAVLDVVISPRDGHGYDPINELGGKYLCLTSTFDSTETTADGKIVNANDFRTFGIIVNPLLANVEVTYTSATGSFVVGDTVTQATTGASGLIVSDSTTVLHLTNVTKSFEAGYIITGTSGLTPASANVSSTRNNGSDVLTANVDYVNTTTKLSISTVSGTFAQDTIVTMTGNVATSNAVVYYTDNSSEMWLTNVRGTIGNTVSTTGDVVAASATITGHVPSDFIYGTGDILYTENISPINKAAGQVETIKAIIEF